MLRNEVLEKDKWKLDSLYKSDEIWEDNLNKARNSINNIIKHQGVFTNNANSLLNALNDYYNLDREITNLYVYASLHSDTDKTNEKYLIMKDKAERLMNEFTEKTVFITDEILKQEQTIINSYINELEDLKKYQFNIDETYKDKPYTLPIEQEELLTSFNDILVQFKSIAANLRDVDLKFDDIKDEFGNNIKVTNASYAKLLESSNRQVREDAFISINKGYGSTINTFANAYKGEIATRNTIAKIRNYKNALSMALSSESITEDIYYNLIKSINNNLDKLHEYNDFKKEMSGLDKMYKYDMRYSDIKGSDKTYPYEEACNIVLNALSPLGDEYVEVIKEIINNGSIDIRPNDFKRGGAYSWGTYDSKPYILLNYTETLSDVSTLAHELGHSAHTYYSNKNNPYNIANYTIFVAEIASTVNEILLSNYQINNSNDHNEKLLLLKKLLDNYVGTVYSQVLFAEFEDETVKAHKNGVAITSEYLNKLMYDLTIKYDGPAVEISDEIKYGWARIPHFYYNFYVYKYAIGFSVATYIANQILKGNTEVKDKYLEFLKLGGSMKPLDQIKTLGIDVNSTKVIDEALSYFGETLTKFKEEYNKVKGKTK